MRSAAYAIAVILVLNIINPKRAAWKDVWNAMLVGCKQAASIAIPTAAVGIIIGVVVNSGLATKLSSLMMKLGSSGMFLALVLSMIGCMLLGMALPTVAAYMIANILCPHAHEARRRPAGGKYVRVLLWHFRADHSAGVPCVVHRGRYRWRRFVENGLDRLPVLDCGVPCTVCLRV